MLYKAMKLRILAVLLDTVIAMLRALDVLYLSLWHAHNAALPRRAGDREQVRRAVEIDYRDQLQ